MVWCTNNKEIKKQEKIKNSYFDQAVATADIKIPIVHALINGVPVSHPPGPVTNTRPSCFVVIPRHMSHFPVTRLLSPSRAPSYWGRDRIKSPVRGKRAASPYPDAIVESSEDDEYWIESAEHQGDGGGPSSAPE
jgi:hypothetical protein